MQYEDDLFDDGVFDIIKHQKESNFTLEDYKDIIDKEKANHNFEYSRIELHELAHSVAVPSIS